MQYPNNIGTTPHTNVLLLAICLLLLTGCRSYQTVPNSYIVKGEDNFQSIQEKLSIYMGPYAGDQMWEGHRSHLTNNPPTRPYVKLFQKLGYDKKTYAVLFTDDRDSKYGIAALINTGNGKSQDLVDLSTFRLNSSDHAKWYSQTLTHQGQNIYHAVIPMYNKGVAEKYLSIIKILPQGESTEVVEHFVQQNAKTYQDLGYTLSNLKLPTCPDGIEEIYHDYTVPESITENAGYYLLKVYKEQGNGEELFFYTLLGPEPITQGAFKACPGKYKMNFTTLQGEVIVSDNLELWVSNVDGASQMA